MAGLIVPKEAMFDPMEVQTEAPLDLTPYTLFGSRLMIRIPTEAPSKNKILYMKMKMERFYEVIAVGKEMEERGQELGLEVGDYVMINPDIGENQLTFVYIDKHKVGILNFFEVFVIRKKGYEALDDNKNAFKIVGETD